MIFRQERKFTFPKSSIEIVRDKIFNSKLLMSNTYPNRFVNTLYLDSLDFVNYNENLAGLSRRSKPRLRWYSNSQLGQVSRNTKIVFEIKLRSNTLGTKLTQIINLPPNFLIIDSNNLIDHIRRELPSEYLPYIDHCTTFSLGVSYEREYFEDYNRDLRITLDTNIVNIKPYESRIFNFCESEFYKQEYCILEMKYTENSKVQTQSFNFEGVTITPGRHSKYATGLYTIYR